MVSVCLPSDALSQHLPSYLGFSYLGCGVSLHGCSSKAQLLLLTLDEGYLHTAAPPHLERGVAPLSCPWPWAWGSSSRPLPLNLGVGYSHEPGGKGGNWNVGKRFYICLTGNNSWLSYLEQTSLIDPFIVPVYLRCNLRNPKFQGATTNQSNIDFEKKLLYHFYTKWSQKSSYCANTIFMEGNCPRDHHSVCRGTFYFHASSQTL